MEQIKVKWSEQINEISAAHSAFLGVVKNPKKDKDVKHGGKTAFSHGTIEKSLELVRPDLSANGLSVMHFPDYDSETKMVVVGQLVSHKSGQWIFSQLSLPVVKSSMMNETQSVGSAITYGKRYLLCSFCAIAAEGEDDESVFQPESRKEYVQPKKFDKPLTFAEHNLDLKAPFVPPKTFLRELSELVKKHEIPESIKDAWKLKHDIDDLRLLSENNAKTLVEEVKKVYGE